MKKHIQKLFTSHVIDYVVITALLVAFMVSMVSFKSSHMTVKIVSVLMAIGYVVWGVTHHVKRGHIDKKILLEYSGIALLGLVIIFSIIN